MNFTKTKTIFLCFVLMLFGACEKEKGINEGEENSSITLSLKNDFTEHIVSFSRSDILPEENDFKIRIENTKAEILKEWDYESLPELIRVVPGSYKLVAWFGSDTILPAFEKPYYYGERKITLNEGVHLDTTIHCTMAAVKVTINFDESFEYDYEEYSVDVKTTGDSLNFSGSEQRAAYFNPGNLRLRFHLKPNGSEETYFYYPAAIGTVEAQEFYKITLKSDANNGGAFITISTDESTEDIELKVDIPNFYLPKDPPLVTPQNFTSGTSIQTTEGLSQKAAVLVSSSGGLTEFTIKTNSEFLKSKGWPETIDLMSANEEELEILKTYGLQWSDEITTQTEIKTTVGVIFDNVINLLETQVGETSRSEFEVIVKDRFNQSGKDDCKLVVDVAPPVFGFKNGEMQEANVYATKAEIEFVYIADRENYFPKVQYKLENGEWQETNTIITSSQGAGNIKISELVSDTRYVFRLMMGEHISEEYVFTTESIIQLPNAGMEDWYNTKVYSNSTAWVGIDIYRWFPWTPENASPWWATRNNLTTSQTSGATCYYTSFSGTISTTDANSGSYAAEISTLGWGAGNTFLNSMTGVIINNKTAGMLFIGEYDLEQPDGEREIFGKTFTSRPSQFSFYYKYTPINSESFEAYIVLENREDGIVEIGKGYLTSNEQVSDYKKAIVNIDYSQKDLKATHMYMVFKSSTSENPQVKNVKGDKGAFAGYSDGKYVGSVLKVDDIELIY